MKKSIITTLLTIVFVTITSNKVQAYELDYYKNMLPSTTQKYLYDIDVKIVEECQSREEHTTLGATYICSDENNKTISMYIELAEGKEFAYLHEMGHCLDSRYKYHNVSNSKKWCEIYLLEKDNDTIIFDGNSLDNSHEFFAECFAQYCVQGVGLKTTHPLAYAFMDAFLKNL